MQLTNVVLLFAGNRVAAYFSVLNSRKIPVRVKKKICKEATQTDHLSRFSSVWRSQLKSQHISDLTAEGTISRFKRERKRQEEMVLNFFNLLSASRWFNSQINTQN